MKNRDTSLGAIFTYCRTRCETNGRNVAKCDDTACPHYTRRMGHDPKRGHRTPVNPRNPKDGLFRPSPDGVKRTLRASPGKIVIPDGYELVLKKKTDEPE